MVIVEGPDGAGKTTLIQQLSETWDIPVAPRVVSKDAEAMVDLQKWVDEQLAMGYHKMIYDRHRLISETIYGPILRFEQQPGFNNLGWLGPRLREFYHHKPTIIYCLPPFQVVWKNITDDPDNGVVLSKIEAIYSAYVTRAALDYEYNPGITKIWDYTTSLKIDKKPIWFNQVHDHVMERFI